jgi:hypothetical protein
LVNLATKALNKLQNMVYDRIPMRTRLKYCLLKVSEIVELKPRQIPSRCLKEWEQ